MVRSTLRCIAWSAKANWDKAPGKNREVKYYLLTPAGKKQLTAQQNKWAQLVAAIGKVMRPA